MHSGQQSNTWVTNMLVFLSMATLLHLSPRVGSSLTVASSCTAKLGMESGKILDYQLSASSSDGSVVGPHNVNMKYIMYKVWYMYVYIYIHIYYYLWLGQDKTTVRNGLVCKVSSVLHTSLRIQGIVQGLEYKNKTKNFIIDVFRVKIKIQVICPAVSRDGQNDQFWSD